MLRWWWVCPAVVLLACGRLDFDLPGSAVGQVDALIGKDARGPIADASFLDAPGTMSIDAPLPPDGSIASCANFDLGSALGTKIASGNTTGQGDNYRACSGAGSPDVSYAWTAPATASFTFDTCSSSNRLFDTTLTVLESTCTGKQLACNDDGCNDGTFLSRAKVSLTKGETVIIVVDGNGDQGSYSLSIAQD
jgi:hypothetical protein